jgi:hypothetical protein
MKKVLTLLHILLLPQLNAQYNKTIRTGRPGQAIGPYTVGKNILQFQQGLEYDNNNINQTNYSYVTNQVMRFGITETIELGVLLDYRSDTHSLNDTLYSSKGLSVVQVGFRVHLSDQKGILPTSGFQARLKMPDVSKPYGASFLAPILIYVAVWKLPKSTSLVSNYSLTYNGYDALPTGKYVLNFGFPIHKNLSGFLENYGQYRGDTFETRFDGGFAWLLNNNVQFDLSAGYGVNLITDYFISGGISWRLNLNKTTSQQQN